MKVITVGGATRDIFIHYANAQAVQWSTTEESKTFLLLQEGAKIEVNSLEYSTGGGATNSATAFKRLGFDVKSFFKVGDDQQGAAILAQMQEEEITVHPCKTVQENTGVSYIIPGPDGDNTVFAFRGANAHITLEEFPFSDLKSRDCVYITSLSGQSSKLLLPVAKYAKEHGIIVANNPGISQLASGADILRTSLQYIDVFILNSAEAQQFMISLSQIEQAPLQEQVTTIKAPKNRPLPALLATPWQCKNICFSLVQFFKTIAQHGPSTVVVTNGKEGVYVYHDQTIYFHPSLPVQVVNTLGAGDAFGSCFVASVLHKKSIEQSIINGIVNSTSVITHLGAKTGLLTLKELETRAKKVDGSLMQKFSI